MLREAKRYFELLGLVVLMPQNKRPSKMTVKKPEDVIEASEGNKCPATHELSEDERSPQWRKEVCDHLARLCDGCVISDNIVDAIEADIDYEANLHSVGSRKELVHRIAALILADQERQAAE